MNQRMKTKISQSSAATDTRWGGKKNQISNATSLLYKTHWQWWRQWN